MNKVCIILRGVSGCGKSSFAAYLNQLNDSKAVICTADDFFTDEKGNYNWNAAKTYLAHKVCKQKFVEALGGAELIVVANTNTQEKEFSFYETEAKAAGYNVFFLIIENRHAGKDCHNVPEEAKDRQENNIRNNLKLK